MTQAIDRHRVLFRYEKPIQDTNLAEHVGNLLLLPLRNLVGRKVAVINGEFQALPTLDKIKKIVLALFCLILSPIVIPMTLLGLTVTVLSSTHVETYKAHSAYLQKKQWDLTTAQGVETF